MPEQRLARTRRVYREPAYAITFPGEVPESTKQKMVELFRRGLSPEEVAWRVGGNLRTLNQRKPQRLPWTGSKLDDRPPGFFTRLHSWIFGERRKFSPLDRPEEWPPPPPEPDPRQNPNREVWS